MKRETLKLLVYSSLLYTAALVIARSFLPEDPIPSLSLLIGPLVIFFIVIWRDLSSRTTEPTKLVSQPPQKGPRYEMENLAKQIEVASESSYQYLENALLNRIRDILVERITIETGIERAEVRRRLANKRQGPSFLGDEQLYNLLYTMEPPKGPDRLRLIEETLGRIESWKP